ncbi:MAG: translocation/assembly module TamB domain-containing protein [Synechococcaceae cyanobacterium]|nr:translocation/assembly module TamB domain-containing protein [Synechococcaceae cyanobacterium]
MRRRGRSGPQEEAGSPRRRSRWLLLLAGGTGGVLVLAAANGWQSLLERIYGRARPWIEAQVSRSLGHPLQLGPLQGVALDGLRIGPSRLLPGARDASTVRVQGASVAVDPFASWRQRQLILDITFHGAEADLRRNADGQVWVLGNLPPGGEPPPLELRLRVLEPGTLRLWGFSGDPARPFTIQLAGQVNLGLRRRALELRTRATAPGLPGSAVIGGNGNWRQRRWQALVEPRGFPIQPLRPLLPLPGRLEGRSDGRVRLRLDEGRPRCEGSLTLVDLRWQPGREPSLLRLERAPLTCGDGVLRLAESRWAFAGWSGQVAGRFDGQRRLALRLDARPPRGNPFAALPIQARLGGRWQNGALQVSRFEARRGASWLRAQGRIGRSLDLHGGWLLEPTDLPGGARLPAWLRQESLLGALHLDGSLARPRLAVETAPARLALIGPWQASLLWSDGLLQLRRFQSPQLQASARLPLALRPRRGLVVGELAAELDLRDFPLQRLDPLVGTRLRGRLDLRGRLIGPLAALRPDLALRVREPGAGPLGLQETWQGRLQASGLPFAAAGAGGSGLLQLEALAPAPAGRLAAWIDQRWLPVRIDLERQGGLLQLAGRPESYRWQARRFPLAGLTLATGPQRRSQPLQGWLSGSGSLGLEPLAFDGAIQLADPRFLGIAGRTIQADVRYSERRYALRGSVETLARGQIEARLDGRWGGPFRADVRARGLSAGLFRQMLAAWPLWLGGGAPARPGAAALGSPAILTAGRSLDAQLLALQAAIVHLAERDRREARIDRRELMSRLQSRIDAELVLTGSDLRSARADLSARGHLWLRQQDRDQALASRPVELRLQGGLLRGEGEFDLSGLSLALLALLVPLPESLRGSLAARGRYSLGGPRPELVLDLALQDTRLGDRMLALERGRLALEGEGVRADLALQAEGAENSLDLAGLIPLDPRREALELRLASRGDGLRFLTRLAGTALDVQRGSSDLQLLIRGSLSDPIANGFLRLRGGQLRFIGQTLREVEATVLFDFEQLLLQELTAKVGAQGRLSGEGRLGLRRPLSEQPTLQVRLERVPFQVPRVSAVGDGLLRLAGSLADPRLGGDVAIRNGSMNATPGQLATAPGPADPGAAGPGGDEPGASEGVRPVRFEQLLESKWDFQKPLVLLGPDVESATAESLRRSIPNVPWLSFDDLLLRLGPDLKVTIGSVGSFRTGGRLRISGRLDPSLQASGVVRLLGGRLNLFTTSFSLDPDAPNVAVFTPSLGLVPYLDIALRTRVSDSLNVIGPSGLGSAGLGSPNGPTLAELEGQGGFSRLNQLKLILVTVSVSGPADRIAENLRLSSSPPLPQERLVALIGGNSLAGLSGGGAGTALATVLGQSLLSPLLGTLSDAFGQRVSFALYPTYVNPSLSTSEERRSGRVPPQLVFGAEVGYDITDRINASLLAAPNRSDVPPQVTLNYKASETFNLEGSIDTQGAWQTQLRVFLRF